MDVDDGLWTRTPGKDVDAGMDMVTGHCNGLRASTWTPGMEFSSFKLLWSAAPFANDRIGCGIYIIGQNCLHFYQCT